jgi:presequence protease
MTHGFELIREQQIPELNSKARLYRHVKTGAQLLSMENEDENKVFGITFRTPPTDSTGVPHIMEHSVLCGSRKYPVKEPFVELLKGSLRTFLNAMTFGDKTCYPVASQNVKDFYNLVDVYLDAVFFPLIPPHTLEQEGWHYELEALDAPLTYKGVVFNEMKGAYSSPDNLLYRYSEKSIFPDTTYGVDSGGDPEEIPNLTYEQFKSFHDTYYHPSNSFIYFYGDDDPEKRLEILDAYLSQFERLDVDAKIELQARFDEPRRFSYSFDASESEDDDKSMVTVNWLLTETVDVQTTFALEMLGYILTGTPASPLRKALIDSGLGEDLAGAEMQDQQRQLYFSTGLRGIASEDAEAVEALILDTLHSLADDGIDPDMIEAAMNTIEFALRENNTGSYPRGLALMIGALSSWLYGGDPMERLAFEAPLNALKENLKTDPRFFEKLIEKHLLNNGHRAIVLLEPDPELRQRKDAAERERLDKVRAGMGEDELLAVIENTRRLKELQSAPDSAEALATIPMLSLDDLEKQNKLIPIEKLEVHDTPVLYHDLFTNGIVYLDVGFNLHALPQEYLPYLSLFSQALLEIGTEQEDFVKLSQRIGRKTGGIYTTSLVSAVRGQKQSAAWMFMRGKSTVEQAGDMLDIMRDVLLNVKLDNRERFRQMLLEDKAGQEARIIPAGHSVANVRLRSRFNEADWVNEQMGGLSYLFFLRQLAQEVENHWPVVLEKLEAVRQFLVNRSAMICNVTLDAANWTQVQPRLNNFLEALPANGAMVNTWTPQFNEADEGLTIPAQVNYVAKGAPLYELGYKLHGSVGVITNFLRTTWLWEKIRVQGGAYGGFCAFDQRSGVFSYLSYRDPNLLSTLDNYDKTVDFLRGVELDSSELAKSIIGTIGDMDAYQLPDAKGYTSLVRHLVGDTDEFRQQFREQVLSTSAADFKAFADVLEQVREQGAVVVVGSQEAIQSANQSLSNPLQVVKAL